MLTTPTPTHTTPHHSRQAGPQENRGVGGGRDRDRTCLCRDGSAGFRKEADWKRANAVRIPALDGLRGVAVLLVFAAHLSSGTWLESRLLWGGGLVGVQLFFALSGYLITSVLLSELDRTNNLHLARFWMRRVRRLYPALVATCLALLVYAWAHLDLDAAIGDVARALTYTTNIHYRGGWLGHTWSLAVEEQFYLAWPVLVLMAYRLGGRSVVGFMAMALIGATVAARYAIEPGTNWALMRWDALLWGCAFAVSRAQPSRALLCGAVGVLVYEALTAANPIPAGQYTLTALASAVAVAGAWRSGLLATAELRYFGRVSYSLYLWHCLVMRMGYTGLAAFALSLLAADLSYRLVELRFWTPTSRSSTPRSCCQSQRRSPLCWKW